MTQEQFGPRYPHPAAIALIRMLDDPEIAGMAASAIKGMMAESQWYTDQFCMANWVVNHPCIRIGGIT